jgi:hypothetical protein
VCFVARTTLAAKTRGWLQPQAVQAQSPPELDSTRFLRVRDWAREIAHSNNVYNRGVEKMRFLREMQMGSLNAQIVMLTSTTNTAVVQYVGYRTSGGCYCGTECS